MLISKLKPKKISSFIGNPTAIAFIKKWAQDWSNNIKQKPVLIWGPSGVGKTALAHAISSEFDWEVFEFNATDIRNEEKVMSLLYNTVSSSTLPGKKRIVLIDDVDSLFGADRGGAGAIAKVLDAAVQPTILTARDYYDKKISVLKPHCESLQLRKVHIGSIFTFLSKAAAQYNLSLSASQIDQVAKASNGDVRAAINDLQASNPYSYRDTKKDIFETVRTIFKSEKYSEARNAGFASNVDHDFLLLWVAHNIPIEYSLPFDISSAYSQISRADLFDGRIKKNQYWSYLRYSSDLMSAGVALSKTKKYSSYQPYSFPDYIREMGSSRSSRVLRKRVFKKISQACHCSLAQSSQYLNLIKSSYKKYGIQSVEYFSFDEEEQKYLEKYFLQKKSSGAKGNLEVKSESEDKKNTKVPAKSATGQTKLFGL